MDQARTVTIDMHETAGSQYNLKKTLVETKK